MRLYASIGRAARQTIEERFAAQRWGPRFAEILKSVARRQTRMPSPGSATKQAPASTIKAVDRVVRGFGDEWGRFDQTNLPPEDYNAVFAMYFGRFPWTELEPDAIGIDIGCGSGRWAQAVAPRIGALHCVDASAEALAVAQRNLADAPNCVFHNTDLAAIPLPDASVDFAFCLGVLHHIPDPVNGLRSCVRLLKTGAPFLLYVYYALDSRPWWYRWTWRAADSVRAVISRMPIASRHWVTDAIAAGVYWPMAKAAKLVENAGGVPDRLPLSVYRNRSFYVMRNDALDRFGTHLELRFTKREVEEMMQAAGLENITINEGPPFWVALGYRSCGGERLHATNDAGRH